MYAQCNLDGEQYLILKGIVDHKKDGHAVATADAHIWRNGRKQMKKTTKGWHLCVEWKDGTTSWEKLSLLKESNPVEVAEYAISAGIDQEPAFKWWVSHVLRKRNRIIAKVNSRYHKRTHKFGFEVPKTLTRALQNGKEIGDKDGKKLVRVHVAFKILEDGTAVLVGHK